MNRGLNTHANAGDIHMHKNNDIDSQDVDSAKCIKQIRYISVDAVITKTPTADASIYCKSTIQNEVLTAGVICNNARPGGTHYPSRFVHDGTYATALQLRPGDKIRIETGRFVSRHGRKETEFHVKRLHHL